ncbi:MAG: response regulator [Fibromonadaceae bacterium]|jgi:PAS domain S-box-containing protein|nr:response regulator [Fibromonadaceae bacterium]
MNETKKYGVLVVDDENNNIIALTSILKHEYTVYAAKDGQSAIEAAENCLPDIILLDIIMPDMDGYAVITAFKNSEKTKDIPVIFVTGLTSPEDEEKGLAFGVADYILKPFSPAIVKLRVRNQIKLLEQFSANEYDIMKYKLSNDALKIALWDMNIVEDDIENPKFKWSQEFRDIIGFSDENDFPNTSEALINRLHPEDTERTIAAFTAHLRDYTGKTPYDIEYRLKKKSGEYRYFHALGSSQRDSAGAPFRMAGAIMDITEKKQAEDKAREEEERLRIMLDAMPLACCLIRRDHHLTYINQEAVNLFGESSKEKLTEKYLEILPELQPCGQRTLEFVYEHIEKAFEEGYLRSEILYQKITTGEQIPCESTVFRVKHRDEFILVAYARDLREQKALIEEIRKVEIAEESSKAKSRFLANMSHEIRTPMNSIMGFTELALDMPDSAVVPQIRDYLKKIKDSAKWLLNIINDILDISKIESGKMELESTPFNLHEVFSRCQTVILPGVKEKRLNFKAYTEPLVGKKLIGDPVKLYQVLMNLLYNAVKFTNSGAINFSSSLKNSDDNSVNIHFEIKDTGIGMTPEQIGKIFKPFIQADSSTTRNYGGTGLGLSITKNIVELMGGELLVESEIDVGSTFSFEITFETVDVSNDVPDNVDPSTLEKPLFDGLILICDDNPMNLEVICEHLARVGLDAVTAENGKLGVETVEKRIQKGEKPFDLILMDMFMPVMDGIEAASKIISLETGTPIVAMTANIMANDLEKYRKSGMPDCLGKPFLAQELWNVLLKYLKPVSSITMIESDNVELQKKLQIYFVKNNQNLFIDITKAIEVGDVEFAHRLVHSLKGNAGQIGKPELRDIASEIENLLQSEAASVPADKMNLLKTELERVLEELKPLLSAPLVKKSNYATLEQIESMLENINPEVVDLLDDIRAIPGTDELVNHIENYDFDAAKITFAELKKRGFR